jgi:formyltetrahydrofolate deformylase
MRETVRSTLDSRFDMTWQLHDAEVKPRVMILVSKIGHCLNDLLFRYSTGQLPIDIACIVSNHRDFYQLAASYNIPFHHLPITKDTKQQQEERIWELHQQEKIDLLVLARYMQILSPEMCRRVSGKAINIHHSFLPSFKGAKPYFQAFDRGVKLVGATAHFVTSDLDEGPIIEQGIERVDHTHDVKALTTVGSTTECITLARAVKWFAERRILMNATEGGATKTVIFR